MFIVYYNYLCFIAATMYEDQQLHTLKGEIEGEVESPQSVGHSEASKRILGLPVELQRK